MKIASKILSKIRQGINLITFKSSEKYWIKRYKQGGTSGVGSHYQLARYKAGIINEFVQSNGISTVIEYGCGDGNQLLLSKYPHYIGFDISSDAISLCEKLFINDPNKAFYIVKKYNAQKADLTLSLDVIYHLVEDDVFENYMHLLFDSSKKFTILYSTNFESNSIRSPHIKHRHFTEWIRGNLPDWNLISHMKNEYSDSGDYKSTDTSKADFFFYQKKA